jgi:hypothetical protein
MRQKSLIPRNSARGDGFMLASVVPFSPPGILAYPNPNPNPNPNPG